MEDNKLIAEFMGGTESKDGVFSVCGRFGIERILTVNLEYATSWDWLMPVVIECFNRSENTSDDLNFKLNDALLETNIDSLYKATVEFIKWYNKNRATVEFMDWLSKCPTKYIQLDDTSVFIAYSFIKTQ